MGRGEPRHPLSQRVRQLLPWPGLGRLPGAEREQLSCSHKVNDSLSIQTLTGLRAPELLGRLRRRRGAPVPTEHQAECDPIGFRSRGSFIDSLTHSFIHSLTRLLLPPPSPSQGSTLPRLRAHSGVNFDSFLLPPLPPHPNRTFCWFCLQNASQVVPSHHLHSLQLVQAWRCISLPTGLPGSSPAPLVFPLAHTASKISKSKTQIRCSPSSALNPFRFPSHSKQKPKSCLMPK